MIQKAVKFYVICAIKRFQAQNGTIPKLGIDVIVLSVQKTIEVGNEISRFFSIDIIPNVYGVSSLGSSTAVRYVLHFPT